MDLSGKLIIKARLGDDVRRIPIHNEDLTYNELILMMQRVFRNTLKSTDEIVIKYADDDGDLITIFDDSDITLAIQLSRILKLTILMKGGSNAPGEVAPHLSEIRDELVSIRNKINMILDSLALESKKPSMEQGDSGTAVEADPTVKPQQSEVTPSVQDTGTSVTQTYNGSMFDPLTDAAKSVSTLSVSADRIASPASSVTSKGSAEPGFEGQQQSMPQHQGHMTNAAQSSFGQAATQPLTDNQQNSLHHANLQSSFGEAALGGPKPPSDQNVGYAKPVSTGYQQPQINQSPHQVKQAQTYPQQQPQSSTPASQYGTSQYGSYPGTQQARQPGQQTPSNYPQAGVQQYEQPSPGSSAPKIPGGYGYGYQPTTTTPNPYSTPSPAQPYATSTGQPYGTPAVAPPSAQGQQQYNAAATPPPVAQQYPPPGAPSIGYPAPQTYGQTASNPHRLIRGGGGYRSRQPGPGYQ